MPATDPTERRLIATVAANESWAATRDRTARTANARAALAAKFLAQADGDPVRAANLRQAYYARLSLKAAQSRRRAKEATAAARGADADLRAAGGPDAAA